MLDYGPVSDPISPFCSAPISMSWDVLGLLPVYDGLKFVMN